MSIPRPIPDDEARLIARAARGSLDAFNALVLMHQNSVYTIAYRLMGDTQAAADITQETFVTAFRRLNTFRGGSFRSWLLRIATNRSYDQLRSSKRHPTQSIDRPTGNDDEADAIELPDLSATPEDVAQQRELRRAIQRCISALGDDQRLVLVLSDVEGLSYEEIAAQSGAQLGTVKSRLSRARANMRDCLRGVRELLPDGYRLKEEA